MSYLVRILVAYSFFPSFLNECVWGQSYNEHSNIVFETSDHGVGLILDIFQPVMKSNGFGIIHAMNGGYDSSDSRKEHFRDDWKLYEILCAHGYTVFNIRPGSAPKFNFEEMVANFQAGCRWVVQHAAEYSVNADRLGMTGASAGGHIVLSALVRDEPGDTLKQGGFVNHVGAFCVFFPVAKMREKDGIVSTRWVKRLGYGDLTPNQARAKESILSPLAGLHRPLPRSLFVVGDQDFLYEDSMNMVEALNRLGSNAEIFVLEGYKHGWPDIDREVELAADWFDSTLAGP